MTNSAPSRRIATLDGLRGLAAVGVMIGHYTVYFQKVYGFKHPLPIHVPIHSLSVLYFFILSGFVICMTMERTPSAREFLQARFWRLGPTYWCAVLTTFGLVSWLGLPGRDVSFRDMMLNLPLLSHFFQAPLVDHAYWSLIVEVLFYLVVAVVIQLGWRERIDAVMAGLVLFSLADYVLEKVIPLRTAPWFLVELRYLLFVRYSCLFASGVFLYRMQKTRDYFKYIPLLLLCLAVCFKRQPHASTAAVVVLSAVTWGAVHGRLNFLSCRPLLWLGAISYPLYLLHTHIGFALLLRGDAAGTPNWFNVSFVGLVSLLLASALHFCVEKPCLAYYKSRRPVLPAMPPMPGAVEVINGTSQEG
jgi:peptidoglycan/LPS O-acetylase OafA/YrhL